MRLPWNEIRACAAIFAREWADAAYEKGETQSFYNDFFDMFGVRRRSVARYEEHVQRLDNTSGFIDLFWPGVLLVEQKSAGRDLDAARPSGCLLRCHAGTRSSPVSASLRFPDVRILGLGRTRGDRLRPCRIATARRAVRLHPAPAEHTPQVGRHPYDCGGYHHLRAAARCGTC